MSRPGPSDARVTPGVDCTFHLTSEREGGVFFKPSAQGSGFVPGRGLAFHSRVSLPRSRTCGRVGSRLRLTGIGYGEARSQNSEPPSEQVCESSTPLQAKSRAGPGAWRRSDAPAVGPPPQPPPPPGACVTFLLHPEEARQPPARRVGQPDGLFQTRFRRPVPPATPGRSSALEPGHRPRQRSHHLPRQPMRP